MKRDTIQRRAMRLSMGMSVAAIALMSTSARAAQETASTASVDEITGDIVVTARRTEEKLKDVPVSITAFGGDALVEKRVFMPMSDSRSSIA